MASKLNQECWSDAIHRVQREMPKDSQKQTILGGGVTRNGSAVCSANELVSVVQTVKADLTAKGAGGIRGNSKWGPRLNQLISVVNDYASIGDVVIQHQPHTTALVWGAFRFIIKALVAQQEAVEEFGDDLDFLTDQIGNYHQSLTAFPHSLEIRQTITRIYALVYSYILRLRDFLRLPRATRIAKLVFPSLRSSLSKIQSNIKDQERILAIARGNAMETLSRQRASGIERSQREMKSAQETDHQLGKIRRWLNRPPEIAERVADWHEGTCRWILEHDVYRRWLGSKGHGCLWIHGKPGCGKSVMAKYLATNMGDSYILTHFFRDHGDYRLGLGSSFASSLIAKVLDIDHVLKHPAFKQVLDLATPLMNMRIEDCQLRSLLLLLSNLLELLPSVTILVDALDECQDIRQSENPLLDFFRTSSRRPDRRVVLLCRSHYALDDIFESKFTVCMDEKIMKEDIARYLVTETKRMGLESLKDIILKRSSSESNGMFLWAKLMIQDLQGARDLKTCRRIVEKFPTELFEAYDKFIIHSNEHLTPDDHDLRYDIFLLLVGAQENLTAANISTAMSISPETHKIDDDCMLIGAENRIARVCEPLIEFTPDGKIQFIHGTVRDFLLSENIPCGRSTKKNTIFIPKEECNQSCAQKTLAALTQDKYRSWQYSADLLENHLLPGDSNIVKNQNKGFYEYSCLHWQSHLKKLAKPSPTILELLCEFLRGNEFVAWSETLFDLTKLSSLRDQISVRATLQAWYTEKLVPKLRPKVPLEDYFLVAHQNLRRQLPSNGKHTVLPYLPLVRLGDFYNMGGETREKWEMAYQFKKEVVVGYEKNLGKLHPLTLSAKTKLYQEYFWQRRIDEAKEGLEEVANQQLVAVGKDGPDYYITLYFLGAAQFHLTLFDDAQRTLQTSNDGLRRLLGTVDPMALQAQLFMGYALEAQEHLEEAIAVYNEIWKKWTHIAGSNNGIALMTQTAQGSVYRKQDQFDDSRASLEHSWTVRKKLFSVNNNVTVDSGIQFAILCRDAGDNAKTIDILDEVTQSTIFPDDFERSCQIDYIHAHIEFDNGQYQEGKARLLGRLHEAGTRPTDQNNRALLWIRITLADVMRAHGEKDEALMLFMNLVQAETPNELGAEPEPPFQLEIAEKALRYIKAARQKAATELLKKHKLVWRRPRDFWILQGGPVSDTARMAAPRDST